MRFLRWLAIWICVPIYKTIPKMYSIFYFLANARFLEEGVVDELSKNLYVLISVVMLFTFAATLLSAIVNPDMLDDGAKKIWAPFKRAIIGLILIILIPFAFDKAYELQADIMNNAVIEKIILGVNYSSENTIGSEGGVSKGGQLIAGNLISSVLYPSNNQDEVEVDNSAFAQAYNNMISSDISNITTVAQHINDAPAGSTDEDEYALDFDGLIALIAGGVTIYILLLYAFDMAVRMFTLAFYELTAPIAIIAYIGLGNKYIMNWAKEVGKVYADVFIRIAAMGFYLFLVSNLTTFFNSPTLWGISEDANVQSVSGFGWRLLLQVIIIVGMLGFVYKVPELIGKAFGIQMGNGARGLAGRLQPVRQAFQDLNNARQGLANIGQGVGRVVGATAGIASNIGARMRGARLRSQQNGGNRWQQAGAALLGAGAGLLTSRGAARRGWQTGNLRAIGNEIARERNTHPEGSTFRGRTMDMLAETVGLGSALNRMDDQNRRNNRLSVKNKDGREIFVTEAQIKEIQSQDNNIRDTIQAGQDAINKELDRKDSNYLQGRGPIEFKYIDENGAEKSESFSFNNFTEASNTLQSLRNSGPREENFYTKTVEVERPKMKEYVDTYGNTKFIEDRDEYGNVIMEKVTQTVKCGANEAGATFDRNSFIKAQTSYQNMISNFESSIQAARKEAVKDLTKVAIAGGDFSSFNTSGDNSNATKAINSMENTRALLSNGDYAINIEQRTFDNYDEFEKINTQAERSSSEIDTKIQTRNANISAANTSEEHMRAERNAQATSHMNGENTMSNLDQNNY